MLSSGFRSTASLIWASLRFCSFPYALVRMAASGTPCATRKRLVLFDPPLGERLVVFHGSSADRCGLQGSGDIRLALKIGLEVACKRYKRFFWLGSNPPSGCSRVGLRRRKVNTVECELLRERRKVRRLRRGLQVHRGCGGSRERRIAVIGDIASYGDCPRLRACAVQVCGEVLPVMLPALAV